MKKEEYILRKSRDIKEMASNLYNRKYIPLLIQLVGFKKLCEIGVDRAGFLCRLIKSNPELLVGIDIWKNDGIPGHMEKKRSDKQLEEDYLFVKKWALEQKTSVKIIRDYSENACNSFEDNFFDFIYIDADHTFNSIYNDLNIWYRKVKIGGILSGHDYHNLEKKKDNIKYGVVEAVNKFSIEKSIPFYLTKELKFPSFIFIKSV